MSRAVVSLTFGTLAACALACSNTTEPTVSPRAIDRQLQPGTPIPIAPGVVVKHLPVFDNTAFTPVAFNDFGAVTGDSGGTVFRWIPGHPIRVLSDTGSVRAVSAGIDDLGGVALTFFQGLPGSHAGVWEPNGTVTLDSVLDSTQSCAAQAVNPLGVIVGSCDSVIVTWTPSGTPQVLRTSRGPIINGFMNAISTTGFIVGDGFRVSPNGQLDSLPQQRTSPTAFSVNDFGVGGGIFFDSTIFEFGAAVWPNPDSVIALAMGAPGTTNGVADDGNAVGAVVDTVRQIVVPFIWNSVNGLRRLPPLELDSLGKREQGRAIAINNRRQILGFVIVASGATRWVIWSY